jgi:RecA/RadA recombinase
MATSTTLGPIALPQPKRTATGAAFKRFVQMKKKFGMFSGSECSQITRLLPASEHLVQGLIPPCSVNIMVGDSGIGKSPMAYQLGLSVAAGTPFLGMRTRPGKVAVIDYENNLADVDSLLKQQTKHLGLTAVPNQFLLWPLTRDPLQDHVEEVIHIFAPDLVVIDSLRTFSPEMESNSRRAVDKIKHLRVTASEHGTAFLLIHHLRKHGVADTRELEQGRALDWLRRAAGVRALINQTDVRLAVARREDDTGDLVLSGHFRVLGEVGPYLIRRIRDEDGEPTGYERFEAVASLIANAEQEAAFERLPDAFAFKDARITLDKAPELTNAFLHKIIRLGLAEKVARGKYQKTALFRQDMAKAS